MGGEKIIIIIIIIIISVFPTMIGDYGHHYNYNMITRITVDLEIH